MKSLHPALLTTLFALTFANMANAQTYQMQIPSVGLRGSATPPPAPVEPPPPPPAVCSAGTAVFSGAGVNEWAMPDGCSQATFKVWGAGGGSFSASPKGGAGGFASGTLVLPAGTALTLRVGQAGAYNPTLFTNSGGGLTGVWVAEVPAIVAGSGGGAGKTGRGGAAGQNSEGLFSGKGALNAPGEGGCGNSQGGEWVGGTVKARMSGSPSGDGGAGRFGGGAGCALYYNGMYLGGGGGGGSNYVAGIVQNPLSLYGGYAVPGNAGDADRGAAGGPSQPGLIVVSYQ
jgi:hypothetical protein